MRTIQLFPRGEDELQMNGMFKNILSIWWKEDDVNSKVLRQRVGQKTTPQPVPDRFTELLDKLEEAEEKNRPDKDN